MRKYLSIVTLLIVLMLAGCGKANETTQKSVADEITKTTDRATVEDGLKLQVLNGDAGAGVTIDNNELYRELNKIIEENPSIGIADDFSLYVVNTIHYDQGNSRLVLLGINRLPVAIKNFAFEYTLGNKNNEYVWEKQRVQMNEEVAGVLEPNSVLPIVLDLSEEQEKLLKSLDNDNQIMAIDNFTFEKVK